ncbi:MAG: sensor histidine kinase [Rhodocyclaceae bacterium]|nr:sensor histidine kinase [Rhodocyclaceae bacterium]
MIHYNAPMSAIPVSAPSAEREESLRSRTRTPILIGVAVILCILTGGLSWRLSLDWQQAELAVASQPRLEFYRTALSQKLEEFRYLPALVGQDLRIQALFAEPLEARTIDVANAYLDSSRVDPSISAVYIMDRTGLTLASSNWRDPTSYIGHNYGFRPYFKEALEGSPGRFYGIGVTTLEPGYFLSAPIRRNGEIIGVAAAKIALDELEQNWQRSADLLLVADSTGVLLSASAARWRYRTLRPLPEHILRHLRSTRQYVDADLTPLTDADGEPLPVFDGPKAIRFTAADHPHADAGGGRYLVQSVQVDPPGWRLLMLTDLSAARERAFANASAATLAVAFLISLGVYAQLRRRRRLERIASQRALQRAADELELRIAERTAELMRANQDLQQNLQARQQAERILTETRDAAIQGGKLAVLGQMAAGITHEINQPLAAMTTLADNAIRFLDLDRKDEVRSNLGLISQLAQRMGRIVAQLKTFSRRDAAVLQPVCVAEMVANAMLLVDSRLRAVEADVVTAHEDPDRTVLADSTRVEQVLVNLLMNACDAIEGRPVRRLTVSSDRDGAMVRVTLQDSGPGIGPEVMPHLFEAFFTTKPAGKGLGLGLALSRLIIESLGGTLDAANIEGGGARFEIRLPPG